MFAPAVSSPGALLWRWVAGLFGRPPPERSKEARLRLAPRASSLLCSSCPPSKKLERSNSSSAASVRAKRPQCGASEADGDLPPGIGQNVDRSVAWLSEIRIAEG